MVYGFVLCLQELLGKTLIPEDLNLQAEELRKTGFSITLREEGGIAKLLIPNFTLPDGYSQPHSDLLVLVPISYPNGKPDMFWVDETVLLANGQVPHKANVIEMHLDRRWRRFSWHLGKWNPGCDNLDTYLAFVEHGLLKARNQ